MPTLARPRPSPAHVEEVAARLATYWDVAPEDRPSLDGLAELINDLRGDDLASPDDCPALLLRQLAVARNLSR